MSITVRGYGLDVFTLSDVPEPAWIRFFRERSAYSRFDFTTAAFRGNLLRVDLPERDGLASLVESAEILINAANIDHQFHLPVGK